MHDAVYLERHGVPTITIAEDAFITAARKGASLLGVPDLPFVVISQARPWETDEDIRTKVAQAIQEAQDRLLAPARPSPASA